MSQLNVFWLPLMSDNFIDGENINNKSTVFGKFLHLLEITDSFKDVRITPNISKRRFDSTILLNIKKIVPQKITVNESQKNIKTDIGYIECRFKYHNKEISFHFDTFGFYFIESEDSTTTDEILRILLSGDNSIIIEHQKEILTDTIINSRIILKNFDAPVDKKNSELSIYNFVKSIYIEADTVEDQLKDTTSTDYIKRIYGDSNFSKDLKERNYNIAKLNKFLPNETNKTNKTNEINEIKKEQKLLAIQDRFERLAIEEFMRVASSKAYFESIISSVKRVREGLVAKVVFLTSNDQDILNWLPKGSILIYENWTEEKIERYVEFIVSRQPSFRSIDKLLRTSYYHKIGNTSFAGDVASHELIDKLAYYQYWENNLTNLGKSIEALLNILHLYNEKKITGELEDIKRQQANENDLSDIESQLGNADQELFGKSDKEALSVIVLIIAGITLLATAVQFYDNPYKDIIFIVGIIITVFVGQKLAPYIRKFIPWLVQGLDKNKLSGDVNFFQYRSRHKVKLSGDYENGIPHLNGDNFLEHIAHIEAATIKSHKDEDVNIIPKELLRTASSKYEVSRLDPHKREIELKYVIKNYDRLQDLFKPFLTGLSDSNVTALLSKSELNIIAIYTFGLRDEGKLSSADKSSHRYFQVYKDGVRIYFKLRLPKEIPLKDVSYLNRQISKSLYCICVAHIHSELNDPTKKENADINECKKLLSKLNIAA